MENFKLLVLKVVVVAYERWSLTRGFKYSDLSWKILVFWKTGRLGELVATGGSTVFHGLYIRIITENGRYIFSERPLCLSKFERLVTNNN